MLIENSQSQYLKFQCGPYGVLIDIAQVAAIEDYNKDVFTASSDSSETMGQWISWNNFELLFVDLRSALEIEASKIKPPLHVLVLKNTATDTPCAIVAIDEVHNIMEIQESQWYALNGINPKLDSFFDRAYPDKESGQIFMRLAPAEQWTTKNSEGINAY